MSLGTTSDRKSTVEAAKSRHGVRLQDGKWRGLMPYEDFPQFRSLPPDEISKIEKPAPEQYSWPDLGYVVDREAIGNSHARKRGLQRMRYVALGLLVLMGVVFVLASINIGQHPWLGYIRAFAEAAMVGALADWFAVSALFRHPLGLPIPHTNIVQERKNDIGSSLAAFIKDNFLTRQNVEKRLDGIDLAAEAGAWLKREQHARNLSLTVCSALRAVINNDNGELGAFVSRHFRGVLGQMDVSSLLARVLNGLVRDDHTRILIDRLAELGLRFYLDREESLRASSQGRVHVLYETDHKQGLR